MEDIGNMFTTYSNNSLEMDIPITALTTGSTSPLTTMAIQQIALLPEYPRTSINGHTFCVEVDRARATPDMVLEDALQVRIYSKRVYNLLTLL